jgi:NAD(P)-dependent dehydrogenase (short-subunit alcohol dehydrogenase family)
MRRLDGKRALVTGAGSGIGRAAARRLAEEGARVVATDLRAAAAEETAAEIVRAGGLAEALELDVTEEAHWVRATREPLDVLVANAGVSFAKPVVDTTLAEWRRVMAVNLDGVFLGVKHSLPVLRDGGSIVVISSASGIKATPGASAYAASKAALRLFAKSVALEVADRRIRVNTVHPAGVETAMWDATPFFAKAVAEHGSREAAYRAIAATQTQGLKRFAHPDEIAATIAFLACDESAFITGAELVIDGGYTA